MKNVAMIVVSALMGALTLIIIMTIWGRTNRSMELQNGLSALVEETVENMTKKYEMKDGNEFLADLTESLSLQLDTDSAVQVEVIKKDMEKGLLSVRVTEEFLHPNGENGTVTCERTVILNKPEERKPQQCKVEFIANGESYKTYVVMEGSFMTAPLQPAADGRQFLGWKDEGGYLEDFSQPVEQDRIYYAEWS